MRSPLKRENRRRASAGGTAAPEAASENHLAQQTVEAAVNAVKQNIRGRGKAAHHGATRQQTIFRSAGDRPYTAISNDFLQNPDIPYDAKGFIAECVSRPRDWRTSVSGVAANNNTIRPRGIRSLMRAAQELGFMMGVRERSEAGQLGEIVYFVSDDRSAVAQAQRAYLDANIRAVAVEIEAREKKTPRCAKSNVASPRCSSVDEARVDEATGALQKKEPQRKEIQRKETPTSSFNYENNIPPSISVSVSSSGSHDYTRVSEDISDQELMQKLRDAAGDALNPKSLALNYLCGERGPREWLKDGHSLQRHILPTIRTRSYLGEKRPGFVSDWSYFRDAIYEAAERRQAARKRKAGGWRQ
jgi:hypothetical protein